MPPEKKSRGGCARCKERKIKCDEGRPFCQRCTKLRLSCPGYQPRLRWSTKYEVFNKEQQPVNRRSRAQRTKGQSSSLQASVQTEVGAETETAFFEDPTRFINASSLLTPGLSFAHVQPEDIEKESEINWDGLSLGVDPDFHELLQPDSPAPDLPLIPNIFALQNVHLAYGPQLPGREDTPSDNGSLSIELSPGGTQLHQPNPAPEFQIPPSLVLEDSVLVEFYFKTIASFYSCFDGSMNPFRTTIGRLWSSSQILTLTLQSMAAACLCREVPSLSQKGFSLRKEALKIIGGEVNSGRLSEISLLSLIMLGQSASWHCPSDVGIGLYQMAKSFVQDDESSPECTTRRRSKSKISGKNTMFFQQALHYWRMLLAFVCDMDDSLVNIPDVVQSSDLRLQTVPHPWALIAPDMMCKISEVGRLVYESRRRARDVDFWRIADSDFIQQTIHRIKELEIYLLDYILPVSSEVVDPSDELTPVSHFLAISEAYRLVALIQIYRVFPDVLLEHLSSNAPPRSWLMLSETISQSWLASSSLSSSPVDAPDNTWNIDPERWIMRLALHIIRILQSLPFESRTRSIQAFLLVAISSELRKTGFGKGADRNSHFVEVIQARNFIMSRLEGYRFVFAPRPAQHKINLVLKIWDEIDQSKSPVYWMDVMIKNGMEVLFC